VHPESGFTRDEIINKLAKNGIEARPAFYPLHAMPIYSQYKGNRAFKNSIYVSKHGLSLPSYVDITKEEQNNVIEGVKNIYAMKEIQKNV
jgi:perosamine synthetase